jgi:amino acid transporter
MNNSSARSGSLVCNGEHCTHFTDQHQPHVVWHGVQQRYARRIVTHAAGPQNTVGGCFGAVCTCMLLPLGEIKTVASVSSFGVLLVFAGVQVAMIRLRFLKPGTQRPFKVPFAIGKLPVLPVIGIMLVLALLTQFEPIVYGVGGGAVVAGLVIYFVFRQSKNRTGAQT